MAFQEDPGFGKLSQTLNSQIRSSVLYLPCVWGHVFFVAAWLGCIHRRIHRNVFCCQHACPESDEEVEFDIMKAEREAGFCTVKQHPKLSPDLDAIEGWWRVVQQRLSLTAPIGLESRSHFLKRLRRAVAWLNKNARGHAKQLCTNQRERARAVKNLRGARCKW